MSDKKNVFNVSVFFSKSITLCFALHFGFQNSIQEDPITPLTTRSTSGDAWPDPTPPQRDEENVPEAPQSKQSKPGERASLAGKRLWRKARISMNVRIAVSPARSLRQRFSRWRLRMRNNRALMVDHLCRVFFPLTFLLFNIIYWSYYSEAALKRNK